MSKEDKELTISQVHTVCRNCVFAETNTKGKTTVQTGCKLGKLEQYEKAGITIHEATDENDNEFKLIDGRFCMFHRNEELMDKYPPNMWEEIVLSQTKVPYQLIVFIEEGMTLKEIRDTIACIKKQKSQPSFVSFINFSHTAYTKDPENNMKPTDILELLQMSELHKFSLKNMYNENIDYRTAIDFVMDSTEKLPYPFYVCFQAGFNIPESFSEDLNNAIFIKMLQIGIASPVDEINGMIVNKTAHKKHGGNSFFIDLEKKIAKYEDNFEKFMYKVTDICPNLKQN